MRPRYATCLRDVCMSTMLYYEYTRAPTLSPYLYTNARTNKNNAGLNLDAAATVQPQPGKQD